MSLTNEDKGWVSAELERVMGLILGEMGTRFSEVNGRLDRMDATLQVQAKQIAGGTKAIAGFTEWISDADADYWLSS